MKDTAPKWQGIAAVAVLVFIVAFGVAWVMYDFGIFASWLVGAIAAAIAAIALALGWRDPQPISDKPAPTAPMSNTAAPRPDPIAKAVETAKAAPAAAAAAPAATTAAAPAKVPESAPSPAKAAAKPAKTAAKPVAADGKPELLSAARAGGPDDLKQIKGVGPKLEKMLHTMGVFHFDQVASWRKKEVAWVDENLEGFKGRVSRDDWVKQAKVLAKGGTTEFSQKVKKGGVY